jgi:hypothetical protein
LGRRDWAVWWASQKQRTPSTASAAKRLPLCAGKGTTTKDDGEGIGKFEGRGKESA